MIYIFDIDGTLANLDHRLHFIRGGTAQNWGAFFAACDKDSPIAEVIEVNRSLNSAGNRIVLLTGRSEECKDKTVTWLYRHGVFFDALYMRKPGDHRGDDVVKGELFDQFLKKLEDGKVTEPIAGVFEDRQQVVDMFRKRGLRVFQVAPGDF